MKKMYLVLVAVVMAIGFSSFTPGKEPFEIAYYNLGSSWQPIENPCPISGTILCKTTVGTQVNVQVYRTQNFFDPVRYTAP